jgi:TonB family protein
MLSRQSAIRAVLASAALFPSSLFARADDSSALKDRLHAAEKDTSLNGDDLKPFYLKLSVQLFDATGKPGEQGTAEVYWKDADHQKRVYSFPSYSATEVHAGKETFRTPNTNRPPQMAALIIEQELHPMAKVAQIDASKPQMQKVTLGKAPLDCIMLARSIGGSAPIPMGLFPTYCFDTGSSLLRVSSNYGGEVVLRNMMSTFQQRHVALDVVINEKQVEAAEGKIDKLEQREIADADLATDGLPPAIDPVRVSSGVIAGMALSHVQPLYPPGAKARNAQGVVVLHAKIGRDGHMQDMQVVSSPDPDLTVAAIDAVRQWTYRPYLLAGNPVEVETTINVNFTFGN